MLRLSPCLALFLVAPVLRAQSESGGGVGKQRQSVQTGGGAVAADPAAPWQFAAVSAAAGTLVLPGAAQIAFAAVPADGDYEVNQAFASEAQLDAAFPSGTYQIAQQGGTTYSIDLAGDLYPPVPELTKGAWNGQGALLVDPTQGYTFDLNGFPGYLTAGQSGQIGFELLNAAGTAVTSGFFLSTTIPTEVTQYPILAGTLTPGVSYTGIISYGTNVVDSESTSGLVLLGSYGSTTSFKVLAEAPATGAPTAAAQPRSITVAAGSTAVFAFGVSSPSSCTYQWFDGAAAVAGATAATLVITGAQAADAGSYHCVATNAFGALPSAAAVLTVAATADPGRLVNISCRAQVGTGADILIAGFAVGGAGTAGSEPLLLRGTGPALAAYGVGGVLPDPELQLFQGSTVLAANAGWGSSAAAVAAADTLTGAFALASPASLDAALVEREAGGSYTAQVSGVSGDTGVALAEVYDATPAGTYTPASPRIINLSARAQVGTGGAIAIAGFAIGGATARTVLIRASGPALAGYGITDELPDPELQLLAGSTVLAQDIGWKGDAQVAGVAARVGAFGWASGSADSALLATLPPGSYTAQVSGATGTTGVALIELYEVP